MARTPRSTSAARGASLQPKRIVVTGGSGLIGRAVVRALRERGDHVVALVRDPRRAPFLAELGAELEECDLADVAALTEQLRGADGVIHAAGSYRIGIAKTERGAMWDANVGTTTRILDAAEAAGTPRIVYVSTANVFGDTHGKVVDETYRRDLGEDFLSWYDETKYGAHEIAEQRIAAGAPIVIVMPSQVYGPGDRSGFGEQLRLAHAGKLRYRAVDDVRIGLVHVDDLAAGIVAALEKGVAGQAYILGGPHITLAEAIEHAARIGDHAPPRLRIPDGVLRVLARLGPLSGQPNLREIISASVGVTYLASSAKAEAELGFIARDLETGLRDVFGAA
ncbi:MAG TPA: NAD-dependent epimerase/dehydratase family protein [Candidatus Limnocylindrales bacterium]|nr:NAD-dependent epimerase/dehydratase family protein [Candidatus Limnocylindrales bacterium]